MNKIEEMMYERMRFSNNFISLIRLTLIVSLTGLSIISVITGIYLMYVGDINLSLDASNKGSLGYSLSSCIYFFGLFSFMSYFGLLAFQRDEEEEKVYNDLEKKHRIESITKEYNLEVKGVKK